MFINILFLQVATWIQPVDSASLNSWLDTYVRKKLQEGLVPHSGMQHQVSCVEYASNFALVNWHRIPKSQLSETTSPPQLCRLLSDGRSLGNYITYGL